MPGIILQPPEKIRHIPLHLHPPQYYTVWNLDKIQCGAIYTATYSIYWSQSIIASRSVTILLYKQLRVRIFVTCLFLRICWDSWYSDSINWPDNEFYYALGSSVMVYNWDKSITCPSRLVKISSPSQEMNITLHVAPDTWLYNIETSWLSELLTNSHRVSAIEIFKISPNDDDDILL